VKLDYAQMDSNSGIEDWGKLMAAGRYGDERAYRRLLGELHNWLTRWYRRRLPTALVDDASQEALIAVHNHRNTYEPSRPFVPWLTSIVRHKGADQLRAAKRRESDPLPDDLAVGDHASAVIRESLLECLMAPLKPAQAEVIRLVKLEGYTIAEASHRTGQSRSLVKINIHRGLAKMQRTAAMTDLLPMTRPRIGRARRPKRRGTRTSAVTLKAPDRVASGTDSLAKAPAVARGGCGTDHAS
jgi:RNA polymerase sigma factor (sigma-70 family)